MWEEATQQLLITNTLWLTTISAWTHNYIYYLCGLIQCRSPISLQIQLTYFSAHQSVSTHTHPWMWIWACFLHHRKVCSLHLTALQECRGQTWWPQMNTSERSRQQLSQRAHFLRGALIYHCLLFCLLTSDSVNFGSLSSLPVKVIKYVVLREVGDREDHENYFFVIIEPKKSPHAFP